MKRVAIAERADWRARVESQGFDFHTIDGERYWDERHYYAFTREQIERDLEAPTKALHEMCLEVVDKVVRSEELLTQLAIPEAYFDLVCNSWKQAQPHIYGRFDLIYDGKGPAKCAEYNADTCTSLLEAASVQLLWLEDQLASGALPPGTSQYNTIAEDLFRCFSTFNKRPLFYFSAIAGSTEDRGTTEFLRRMATLAGIDTRHIDVQDIGLDSNGRFVDEVGNPIERLFKLHPWEDIFLEAFGPAIEPSGTLFYEPPWKAIVSNKGILPLLWDSFKGHPNLLPAYVDRAEGRPVPRGWVRKPYFSREGANVEMCSSDGELYIEQGPYTQSPQVLQQYHPLPRFGDSYAIIGSWVIADQPAGIGIREDDTLITKDTSRFLPHAVID